MYMSHIPYACTLIHIYNIHLTFLYIHYKVSHLFHTAYIQNKWYTLISQQEPLFFLTKYDAAVYLFPPP